MDLAIKDHVIIVTGGSKGIGEGITRSLANEGAIPVIAGRSTEKGEKLVSELNSKGQSAHFIFAELALRENCEQIVKETLQKYGRLNGLVNNAGINDSVGLEAGIPKTFWNR